MKRSGWLMFASVVLIIAGVMRILDAIWAFSYNGTVVNNLHGAIFGHSLTGYGVIWLIVGLILIAAGVLVLNPGTVGAEIARWVGIVAAAIGAVTAISWMPYYPEWSLLYIGLAILVIYGLVSHFEEPATTT
jgi:hypothetical protein